MSHLGHLIEEYLLNCEKVRRLSVHTNRAYRNDLGQFQAMMADEPISIGAIHKCVKKLAGNPRYKVHTIKRKIAAIRSFLRFADEKIASLAFASLKLRIKAPMRLPKAISRSELGAVLKLARENETGEPGEQATTYLALSLLAATGLRIAELCALRLSDVNLGTGEIKVFGKGAKERIVIITNVRVLGVLKRFVRHRIKTGEQSASLFLNYRGKALTPQCLRLRLHRLVRTVGLGTRVTPHVLRHTAATLLIERGVDIRFVQRLLGHASIATTQIYTHVTDSALRIALNRADVMRGFA